MDESEKHVQTQKGMTIYFHLYEVQEQVKLSYNNRNQSSGCLEGQGWTGKGYEESFRSDENVLNPNVSWLHR